MSADVSGLPSREIEWAAHRREEDLHQEVTRKPRPIAIAGADGDIDSFPFEVGDPDRDIEANGDFRVQHLEAAEVRFGSFSVFEVFLTVVLR